MSTATPEPDTPDVAPTWRGLVDDAATFPPGNAPLPDALAAHLARRGEPWAAMVGRFVVKDTDLPQLRDFPGSVSVVVTGGAGQIAGPVELAARHGVRVEAVEVALRDLDDLAGNARRVTAAVDAIGVDDLQVYVELPTTRPGAGWLAAADEVAAAELRLKLRTGGLDASAFPSPADLAACIDAALDRETPFKCTAGLHHAVRHEATGGEWTNHGFLNVLLATAAAWDGADQQTVAGVLAELNADVLLATCRDLGDDLARARRWFASFGCCDVTEPHDDLVKLGLLEA